MEHRLFPLFVIFFLCLYSSLVHSKKYFPEVPVVEAEAFSADAGYYQSDAAAFGIGSVAALASAHQMTQQKCVEIPQNMSLCYGIGYSQMLLPNLLNHDSVRESSEQSSSWIPLANIKCHQHTQLFLCSLFAPICPMQQTQPESFMQADQALPPLLSSGPTIWPCRSLCESVRAACQGVMSKHGFPWPEFLTCSRFPLDNDMCIAPNGNGDSGTQASSSTVKMDEGLVTSTVSGGKQARTRKVNVNWPTTVPPVAGIRLTYRTGF